MLVAVKLFVITAKLPLVILFDVVDTDKPEPLVKLLAATLRAVPVVDELLLIMPPVPDCNVRLLEAPLAERTRELELCSNPSERVVLPAPVTTPPEK